MSSTNSTQSTWPEVPAGGWQRVLLKLSGEAFAGGQGLGVDPDTVQDIARQIADVVRHGVQVAVVIGGGNYFRGAQLSERGMDRGRADYMGMLGTVMNCLALQDFLEKEGCPTRVQTAISMGQVAEPYVPLRAIRHLEKQPVAYRFLALPSGLTAQHRPQSSLPTAAEFVHAGSESWLPMRLPREQPMTPRVLGRS